MVAHHTQHRLAVLREAREGAEIARQLRRCRIGLAGHDGGGRAADRRRLARVVGDALAHQHRAHVRVAEPERPEIPALLGDGRARVRAHQHADLEDRGPQPARVAEALDVEASVLAQELHEIDRREVARGVVQEHVLRAVVDDEAGGDEVMGRLLGQIEDVLLTGRLDRDHLVRQIVAVRADFGIEPREDLRLGARRMEADLALEDEARGPADPEREHRLDRILAVAAAAVGQDGRGRIAAPAVVELGLDPERQQQELNLAEERLRARVEAHVLRLLSIVGHRPVGGEQAAQHRGKCGAVEIEDLRREALAFRSLVEDPEAAEQVHHWARAERQASAGPVARDLNTVVPPD